MSFFLPPCHRASTGRIRRNPHLPTERQASSYSAFGVPRAKRDEVNSESTPDLSTPPKTGTGESHVCVRECNERTTQHTYLWPAFLQFGGKTQCASSSQCRVASTDQAQDLSALDSGQPSISSEDRAMKTCGHTQTLNVCRAMFVDYICTKGWSVNWLSPDCRCSSRWSIPVKDVRIRAIVKQPVRQARPSRHFHPFRRIVPNLR